MNKKLLTIFLSLFLVGILSISCSNEDKTAPKGIEQYNNNIYVSTETVDGSAAGGSTTDYLWISVKDGQAGMNSANNNNTPPSTFNYFPVTGSGTDYSFSIASDSIVGTFKFESDGSKVTVRFTKNPYLPINKNIICNKR
ncbi:hypothetical protein R4J03_13095 [Brachyspira intermedia]|uniref:hypothetical protein n=1 Tax=Brachyspira intermedia TaxID=84377 RepID=UPI00300658B6